MRSLYKIIEYAYLLLALFLLVEGFRNWNQNPQKAYIFLAFSAAAVFMYFFKRKFRGKIEDNDKKQQ